MTEWIKVEDRLPEIPSHKKSYERSIKVIVAWGGEENNVTEMHYCEDVVRNKTVNRFKWRDRISPWVITHWMPLPNPPQNNQ